MTENVDDGRGVPARGAQDAQQMQDAQDAEQMEDAQEALARSARAGQAGEAAARRYRRRYLLGLGVLFAAWLVAIAASSHWLETASSLERALVLAVATGLSAGLAVLPAQAEPVRARIGGRGALAMVAGGVLIFAGPAGLAGDRPVAAVVGVPLVLGYWAACAWWWSRAR